MASPKVIPWNSDNPNYNFETNPGLKLSYASAIGSAAANKAKQLNSTREEALANKFSQENGDMFDRYSRLSERGGKNRKKRSTKRRKSTKKARKTKRNARRRK
jgi:hypothetical protein